MERCTGVYISYDADCSKPHSCAAAAAAAVVAAAAAVVLVVCSTLVE